MTDNRKFPRIQVRVPIFISIDGTVFRKTIRLESTDVSGGGVAFETSREVPLDAESRVVVAQLGDLGEPALIRGRVARIYKSPETGRYIVAIEFTSFENTTRDELIGRIDTWAR
jgi:c-di-GMP-binding flagellar brake protein YcgR